MPLPESTVKELLSVKMIEVVAARMGWVGAHFEKDFGTDVHLRQVQSVGNATGHGSRYAFTGLAFDVQVKATCESQVVMAASELRYDLEVKNYNDLVRRRNGNIPQYLALFVLPDDAHEWMTLEDAAITLRRCGYLWRPDQSDTESTNAATKRIVIPLNHRIGHATFDQVVGELVA